MKHYRMFLKDSIEQYTIPIINSDIGLIIIFYSQEEAKLYANICGYNELLLVSPNAEILVNN